MLSVVLDKMYVFCLYPIPDSQQYVKRSSCRRLILSRLPYLFFVFCSISSFVFLNILYSNCVVIICFSNLIIVRVYLSYFIVLCFNFITLSFGGLKADKRLLPARPTARPPLPSWYRHDRPKLAPHMVQPRLSSPRHVPRNLAHQGLIDADRYTRCLTAATKV